MSAWDAAGPAAIEPWPIPDTFATGRFIESHGPFVRVVFFCDRRAGDGCVERVIVARIIMDRASYAEAVRQFEQKVHAGLPGAEVH